MAKFKKTPDAFGQWLLRQIKASKFFTVKGLTDNLPGYKPDSASSFLYDAIAGRRNPSAKFFEQICETLRLDKAAIKKGQKLLSLRRQTCRSGILQSSLLIKVGQLLTELRITAIDTSQLRTLLIALNNMQKTLKIDSLSDNTIKAIIRDAIQTKESS